MRRPRDNQRSRVYAWERRAVFNATGRSIESPDWQTLGEVEAWLVPIWRAERGRVGLAHQPAPELARNLWGMQRATATHSHTLKLPKWSRSKWIVLHEAAHRLTPTDEAHGGRFVGVLIGLAARHAGHDAERLMRLADEFGVRYHVRSIGAVPTSSLADRLAALAPVHEVEAAIELGLTWRQVRGAVLASRGALRMRGRTVIGCQTDQAAA